VWLIVGKYAKQLGIQATPHGFRHALACRMLNNDSIVWLSPLALFT
jgi:integrase